MVGSCARLDAGSAPARVERIVHGHRFAVVDEGNGPPVLLLHGLGDSADVWVDAIGPLARHHRVIAPDLLGHGRSECPRTDYSVPAQANGIRDLLTALGVQRVSVIGHSLGGGLAMQLAYQFPGLVERLLLVAPGGVTRDVHPALRMLSLPGADEALALLGRPRVRAAASWGWQRAMRRAGNTGAQVPDLSHALEQLSEPDRRRAFVRTVRGVVDWQGQLVSVLERQCLPAGLPVLLVWGSDDPIIPVAHGRQAHGALPGSRLEIFPGAGHFPFRADPERFRRLAEEFLGVTDHAAPDAALVGGS